MEFRYIQVERFHSDRKGEATTLYLKKWVNFSWWI